MDLVPGGGVGGSFIIEWFELACTAREFRLGELRNEVSSADGDELILEALRLVALRSLCFARVAGS